MSKSGSASHRQNLPNPAQRLSQSHRGSPLQGSKLLLPSKPMALPWAAVACAFSALDPGSVDAITSRITMGCRGPPVCTVLSPRALRLRVKPFRSPTSACLLQIDPRNDCGLEARATFLSLLCFEPPRENIPAAFCEARPQGMTKHAPPGRKADASNFGEARSVVTGSTD